jgi:6-phosphogluconolactonase/glucosamine-6-phosphate isomerase/deaminase
VSGERFRESVFKDRRELARAVAEGLAADRVWVLIAGADKHPMIARCREARARGDRPVPLLGVSPTGELVWWLDEAASSGA